ncbi:MAG: hypothetical protein D3904_00310 [Candidatus Electrothrix sp. EH2]|nr:hypothetical protein [Candidatus Electrothrix sp. EH2]
MKNIWMTALAKEQVTAVTITGIAAQYGLNADGHFWTDDLKNMTWTAVRDTLRDKAIALWVIAGGADDLLPETRYGLTLLCLSIRAERPDISILWADSDNQPSPDSLPGVFADVPLVGSKSSLLGAKLAAGANTAAKPPSVDYRLAVHANPGFGVWFEVGPAAGQEWPGTMFAVTGGEILAHGVGPAGTLPQKCVLEYPMQGMQLNLGGTEYTGWAVANRLDKNASYFVKVDGVPSGFLFGPAAEGDEAEVYVVGI